MYPHHHSLFMTQTTDWPLCFRPIVLQDLPSCEVRSGKAIRDHPSSPVVTLALLEKIPLSTWSIPERFPYSGWSVRDQTGHCAGVICCESIIYEVSTSYWAVRVFGWVWEGKLVMKMKEVFYSRKLSFTKTCKRRFSYCKSPSMKHFR